MIKKLCFVLIILFLLSACSTHKQVMETNYRCSSSSYTVREPVEVIYKDTTYTTIYKPYTYTKSKYIKKPYSKCDSDLCK